MHETHKLEQEAYSSSDGGFSDDSQKKGNKKKGGKEAQQKEDNNCEVKDEQNELADIRFFNENLPPSQPIVIKDYSLEADMLFGWQPKIQFQGPVPMKFDSTIVDIIVSHLNNPKENKTSFRLIYLGFRPQNTLKLHECYCDNTRSDCYYFKFNSLYGNSRMSGFFQALEAKNKNKFIFPFLGMNPNLQKFQNKTTSSDLNTDCSTHKQNKEILNFLKTQQTDNSSFMLTLNGMNKFNEMNYQNKDNEDEQSSLIFDSYFESGNLDCAVKVGQNEYDLFMRVDSNTKGHLQWYYFKVKAAKAMQRVKFNICNFSKSKSLYMRGMKPYVFSQKENQFFKTNWSQQGDKITYQMREFRYAFIKEYMDESQKQKTYYSLSFEYTFKYQDDVVSFAYCPPYTFSTLTSFIKELSLTHKQSESDFFREEKLCSSMSGLDVPLLTITDFNSPTEEIEKRKVVIVSARIHPGESNSSYVMHGFLQHLFREEAFELRKKCIFKIIPMMNPDGVVLGNYRTGIAGRDLNRVFANPDKMLFPTVIGLKDLVSQIKKQYGQNVILFLDLHGHSVKKNVFTYGPDYPIFDLNYYKCRLFSKILAKTTDMFRFFSCIFRISQMKKNTARGIFFNNYDIGNCFTLEASNGSYYIGNQKTIDFTTDLWIEMGVQITNSIDEYIQTILDYEKVQQTKMEQKILEREIKQEEQQQQSYSSTQATTVASRSDNSGFITSRTVQYRNNLAEELSPTNLIRIKNDKILQQKYQSDSEQEINLSKGNFKLEKKKKNPSKNKANQKNSKLAAKNTTFNKQFLLEDSPFSKYFVIKKYNKTLSQNIPFKKSKQAEDQQQTQQFNVESDAFSEGGSDSESEGEDYDKAFLKNFQASVQRDFQLFDKFFKNVDNIETVGQESNQKRERVDLIKVKDDYLNERITQDLSQQKYDVSPLLQKADRDQSMRSSLHNQPTFTPKHLRTPVIRPKTNDRFHKNDYIIKEINSQRNTPQKQHTVMNSVAWDIFKERNFIKRQLSRNCQRESNGNSNLLQKQLNFSGLSDQRAVANQLDFDKYDDLYSQEFTMIDQAIQQQNTSRTAGRKTSATYFKDDNLNIINFLHKVSNQPIVSTTDNQSLMKIIHKIKDGEKRDEADEGQGKRVIVLTNYNLQPQNSKNHIFVNRQTLEPLPNQTIRQNRIINQSIQGSPALHLKNILNTPPPPTIMNNNNNLFYIKDHQAVQKQNQQGVSQPSRQNKQYLLKDTNRNQEYVANKTITQHNIQDKYYTNSNRAVSKEEQSQLICMPQKRDSQFVQNNVINTNSLYNNNTQLNTVYNTKLISSNNSLNSTHTPIQSINNTTNSNLNNLNRRISHQPHFTSNQNNVNQIINASFAFQSPRDNSTKKINCPSAFYKIKKHFTSKKKTDEQQKYINGYNPNYQKQQPSLL